jgi:hypothetical protein
VRDDIGTLPLSAKAKAYARRKGLKSMMRQPDDFVAVNAEITNPGKPNVFKNYDAAGSVKKTWENLDMDANTTKKKSIIPGKAPAVKKTFKAKKPAAESVVKEAASELVERLLAKPTAAGRS